LVNGYKMVEHDGEEHVFIDDEEALHDAIARHVICTRKGLTGKEIRFLRNVVDWTQQELAQALGNNSQSVARWEKGKVPIPADAEKLLRVRIFVELLTAEESGVLRRLIQERLSDLDEMDEVVTPPATFMLDHGWRERSGTACR
jgi:DNA-binding transcriptional regulator YiaG